MPVIQTPFPNIAVQVIQPKGIRWKAAHFGGLFAIYAFGSRSIGAANELTAIVIVGAAIVC